MTEFRISILIWGITMAIIAYYSNEELNGCKAINVSSKCLDKNSMVK